MMMIPFLQHLMRPQLRHGPLYLLIATLAIQPTTLAALLQPHLCDSIFLLSMRHLGAQVESPERPIVSHQPTCALHRAAILYRAQQLTLPFLFRHSPLCQVFHQWSQTLDLIQ